CDLYSRRRLRRRYSARIGWTFPAPSPPPLQRCLRALRLHDDHLSQHRERPARGRLRPWRRTRPVARRLGRRVRLPAHSRRLTLRTTLAAPTPPSALACAFLPALRL